jgi:hypothetical protein
MSFRPSRAAQRVGATAAAAAGLSLAALALATPANAATSIVDLPAAPTYTAVDCTAANSASVATAAEFNAAYTNTSVNCITLSDDIAYTAAAPFTGANTVLDRPMSIDGGGNTLTFGVNAAGANRPFYLANNATADAGLTFELRNVDVAYAYNAWLVSSVADQGRGWSIVLDDVTLDGIPGVGSGSPNGRPVTAYLADLHLEGAGTAENTYGRFFPGNLIVAEGAAWKVGAAAAAPHEPQFDMSYGLTYGPERSGSVHVAGSLDVTGGAYSAIWGFNGIYVGSAGDLTATSDFAGGYGALTTAAGGRGVGEIWIDDNGSLAVSNPSGVAIYAVAGAPLDLRADNGARVDVTGSSTTLGAITLATPGSKLAFNNAAHLDVKNVADSATGNWAIASLGNNPAYTFDLSIVGQQVATWNHETAIDANPDFSWDNVSIVTDQTGAALTGTSDEASDWNLTDYRRIFIGTVDTVDTPVVDPALALGALALAGGAGAAGLIVRRRAAAATQA